MEILDCKLAIVEHSIAPEDLKSMRKNFLRKKKLPVFRHIRLDQYSDEINLDAVGGLVPHAHGAQPARDDDAVNSIPVADHVARSFIPRECFCDLAGNPLGWTKNQRSWFVNRARPCSLRRKTFN
jgi:hypothetical protein